MKLGVRLDQSLYLSSRARLDQAKGYLANDLVTLIAPGPSIARAPATAATIVSTTTTGHFMRSSD